MLVASFIALGYISSIPPGAVGEMLRRTKPRELHRNPWDSANCGNYELTVNCTLPTEAFGANFVNVGGGTNDKVKVEIYSHCNWRNLVTARTYDHGFCQNGNGTEVIQVNDACMVDGISIFIDGGNGGDPMFINNIKMTRDGEDVPFGSNGMVYGWGVPGRKGWCLSENPSDYVVGKWPLWSGMDFEAECQDHMHFDWQRAPCTLDQIDYSCIVDNQRNNT